MNCCCKQQAELIDLEDAPRGFEASLIKKDIGNWVYLMECPECGQLWRIDIWDKYKTQFAFKLPAVEGWESVDIIPLQKGFLLGTVNPFLCTVPSH
jgi:hypothetical protein